MLANVITLVRIGRRILAFNKIEILLPQQLDQRQLHFIGLFGVPCEKLAEGLGPRSLFEASIRQTRLSVCVGRRYSCVSEFQAACCCL